MAKKSKGNVSIRPDEEWQVESDLRTLMEAKVIRADAKRFAKCRALAKKKLAGIASVAGAGAGSDNDGDE